MAEPHFDFTPKPGDAFAVEFPDLVRIRKRLQLIVATMPKVAKRALNRGVTSARQSVIKSVARHYGVKAKDLRKKLRIKKATAASMEATIEATGSVPRRGRQTATGVTFRGKAEPRKMRHAFVWDAGAGRSTHVFIRFGPPRLPIRQIRIRVPTLWTPDVPAAQAAGAKTIDKTITHELGRL